MKNSKKNETVVENRKLELEIKSGILEKCYLFLVVLMLIFFAFFYPMTDLEILLKGIALNITAYLFGYFLVKKNYYSLSVLFFFLFNLATLSVRNFFPGILHETSLSLYESAVRTMIPLGFLFLFSTNYLAIASGFFSVSALLAVFFFFSGGSESLVIRDLYVLVTIVLFISILGMLVRFANIQIINRLYDSLKENLRVNKKFRMLYENSRDAVLTVSSENYSVIEANPSAIELFRAEKEENFQNLNINAICTDQKYFENKLVSLDKNYNEEFRFTFLKFDKERFHAVVSLTKIETDEERLIFAVIKDISEEIRLEELNRALTQSAKMAELGAFAAGIAHELRNPLSGISQTIELLRTRLFEENLKRNIETARECGFTVNLLVKYLNSQGVPKLFTIIDKSNYRANEIVENMLLYARKSEKIEALHDLSRIISETLLLANFNSGYKTISNIGLDSPKDSIFIKCRKSEIQQVILNIINNSVEAMADLKLKNRGFRPEINIRSYKENGFAVIEIEDNGPGMDSTTLKRIFEPFYTTKEPGKGTGLGMYISKIIIDSHGGEIKAESFPGIGSKFVVRLPESKKEIKPECIE